MATLPDAQMVLADIARVGIAIVSIAIVSIAIVSIAWAPGERAALQT
jgi:hypothetical protein